MHLVPELLTKGVREPCEPADPHADVEVLPLHMRRADVLWGRVARDDPSDGARARGWTVAALRLPGRAVNFDELGVVHNAAFHYVGGVPRGIVYDNTKRAVARILGDGTRQRTQVFSELQSHYLFDDRFGRPGKGNDKGKVEGLVGYARRNWFVPIPHVASWDALNADLARQCRDRRGQRLRRHTETIGERFARDRAALLPLPPVPYEACDTRPTRVTSLSLVRYRRNDYSVPTAYGHREVVVKGFVDEVVIVCGSEEIARHRRSYEREALIFEPRHYLALLERKIGALATRHRPLG